MTIEILPKNELTEQPIPRMQESTEHPHVVWIVDTPGKKLVLSDSHIQIWVIASMFRQGSTAQDLIETYPQTKPAAIYDAISYYLDHPAEIEQEIEHNKIENVLVRHNAQIDLGGFVVFDE